MKFGRTYQMTLAAVPSLITPGGTATVSFPTTLDINVVHDIDASVNTADFSLYNLSAVHRNQISYNQAVRNTLYQVTLNAGYVSQSVLGFNSPVASLPQIFNGYGLYAYTERQGDDLITRVNALDNGDILNQNAPSFIGGAPGNSITWTSATPFKQMVLQLMGFLRNVTVDPKTSVIIDPKEFPRLPSPPKNKPRPFTGDVWTNLKELASEVNAYLFIDNGVCRMLSQNSVITNPGLIPTLNAASGLLEIPRVAKIGWVECSCIFEPSFSIGTLIYLKSTVSPLTNGEYKIVQYTHEGRISGVDSGDMYTSVVLQPLTNPVFQGAP